MFLYILILVVFFYSYVYLCYQVLNKNIEVYWSVLSLLNNTLNSSDIYNVLIHTDISCVLFLFRQLCVLIIYDTKFMTKKNEVYSHYLIIHLTRSIFIMFLNIDISFFSDSYAY